MVLARARRGVAGRAGPVGRRCRSPRPMDDKIALALELERATRGADRRVRQVSSADYSDGRVEVALASTTGIRSSARRTTAFVSVDAIAGEGADSQTGTGFSVGRAPGRARPRRGHGRRRAARHPAARRPEGQVRPVHRGLRPPGGLHPALGGGVGPLGRGRGQGPLVLRRADRRVGGQRRRHPGRRPHRQPGLQRLVVRRRGTGLPAQCADLRRHAAHVRLRHGVGPPGPDAVDRFGRAGRLRRHAVGRLPGPGADPGDQGRRRDPGLGRRRASTSSRSPASTRGSIRSAGTSRSAPRA